MAGLTLVMERMRGLERLALNGEDDDGEGSLEGFLLPGVGLARGELLK